MHENKAFLDRVQRQVIDALRLSWTAENVRVDASYVVLPEDADDDWQVRTFDPSDPSFYGHAWNARPEQAGRRPADLHDD